MKKETIANKLSKKVFMVNYKFLKYYDKKYIDKEVEKIMKGNMQK